MQLIDLLSPFLPVYFNRFFFLNLKQNVPLSPPTPLELNVDGFFFSGYNLISASPAGLM